MKRFIKQIPIVGGIAKRISRRLLARRKNTKLFAGSAVYWEKRYAHGGNSGVGSYGFLAEFKAEVLNRFVAAHQVQTVIEFGCGDGNQLTLAEYPTYLGFDVSRTAISQCQTLFKADGNKAFRLMGDYNGERADLTLSLDVIYHLVEDSVFEDYMRTLFDASERYVIIYSSDSDGNRGHEGTHIRHRKFTGWVRANRPDWKLVERLPNRYPRRGGRRKGSCADFFIYEKVSPSAPVSVS